MRVVYTWLIAAILGVLPEAGLAQSLTPFEPIGDPVRGADVFVRECARCHRPGDDGAQIGPDLAGVVDRRAGSSAGFAYSTAMRFSGIVWDADSLRRYLANPQEMVTGNKMDFTGLSSPQERIDVITYLKGLDGS